MRSCDASLLYCSALVIFAAARSSDKLDSGLVDAAPYEPARPKRAAAIERHVEALRQIERVGDVNACADIRQISHDAIHHRRRPEHEFRGLEHARASGGAAFLHAELPSIRLK